MRQRATAALLSLAAMMLAACGGSGGDRSAGAAADSAAAPRVWTPDQARALRQARERGETIPLRPAPVVGPLAGEDSAQWAAEENARYDERVKSMQPYASCMAQARAAEGELRTRIEEGCRRLPTAPH
jgi:hypothetical protein